VICHLASQAYLQVGWVTWVGYDILVNIMVTIMVNIISDIIDLWFQDILISLIHCYDIMVSIHCQ
jgi:hypothetical protein